MRQNGVVAVIGSSVSSDENAHSAERIGGILAGEGCVLACGGSDGEMRAIPI